MNDSATSLPIDPPPPQASPAGTPSAAERCSEAGCANGSVEPCAYVDSRGTSCQTRWCKEHGVSLNGRPYCRRHAGTVAALGSKANNPRALPDVGHRGASLVRWVYRDLDAALGRLLESVSRTNERVLRDTEVSVGREPGGRYWEMSWKLASPTGVRLRISLRVEEGDDAMVLVRVGDSVLASGRPPWIENRQLGKTVSEEEDREQRRVFYTFLEEYLTEAVRPV